MDNDVISGDDNDDMNDTSSDLQGSNRPSYDYRSDESDDEHCSFEYKLKLVDFDKKIWRFKSIKKNMEVYVFYSVFLGLISAKVSF